MEIGLFATRENTGGKLKESATSQRERRANFHLRAGTEAKREVMPLDKEPSAAWKAYCAHLGPQYHPGDFPYECVRPPTPAE
jgi:hypothetical protein